MITRSITEYCLAAAATMLLCLGNSALASGDDKRVYRWKDSAGVSHYGDSVPPEYADSGHAVLNKQGVEVDRVEGARSAAQLEAERELAERAEHARLQREAATLRDKVLLSTYLSVDEIKSLRDQRLAMIDGQMQVAQKYLDNLRQKIVKLEREVQRYSPYSINPDAKPIDEKLAQELSDTLQSIILYEKTLARYRDEQKTLQQKFAADIKRFSELRGLSNNR